MCVEPEHRVERIHSFVIIFSKKSIQMTKSLKIWENNCKKTYLGESRALLPFCISECHKLRLPAQIFHKHDMWSCHQQFAPPKPDLTSALHEVQAQK